MKTWVSSDACPTWLLLLSSAQHLVLTQKQASVACVVHAAGRLEGDSEEGNLRAPLLASRETRFREKSIRGGLWF